jgi:hypothetical protein
VEGSGDQLFARPALALDEDGGVGGRDPSNEIEYLAHGETSANHIVFELDFSAQLLVFLPQIFPVTHVVKGQAGDAGNCGHHLQVAFVELYSRVGSVQIDGAQNPASHHERNTKQGLYFQFKQSLDLAESFIPHDIAHHQTDAFFHSTLHHGAADPNRMAGPAHPVPGSGRSELFRVVAEQNGAALGWDNVEYEAQELPLQRFLVANATDSGGDLQQGIQVAGAAR